MNIFILNSGDIFYDDFCILYISKVLNKEPDLFIGKVAVLDENGKKIVSVENINLKQIFRVLTTSRNVHKKRMFDKYGLYDINYKLGMDYEWSLRIIKDKIKVIQSERFVSKMLYGGISVTNYIGTFKAFHEARIKHSVINRYSSFFILYFYVFKRSFGNLIRYLLKRYISTS